jgi:hypothetical protein
MDLTFKILSEIGRVPVLRRPFCLECDDRCWLIALGLMVLFFFLAYLGLPARGEVSGQERSRR